MSLIGKRLAKNAESSILPADSYQAWKQELMTSNRLRPGDTTRINSSTSYHFYRDHRNNNRHKSQWCISCDDELTSFSNARANAGVSNAVEDWGLHCPNGRPEVLGTTVSGERVKMAKFVGGASFGLWHGYPADYRNKPQDRSPVAVLTIWLNSQLIQKNDITKVRRGQKCNLSD